MFERRLKILLLLLVLSTAALVFRAFQIQAIQRNFWRQQARENVTRFEYTDTTRGAIRDRLGRILAQDWPSIDACVDYRAITPEPDPRWLHALANNNLHTRLKDGSIPLQQEEARIKGQIVEMWGELAQIAGKTPDQIDAIRRSIQQRVQLRENYVNFFSEQAARRDDSEGWYNAILASDINGPGSEKSNIVIDEQLQPHVIVQDLKPDQQAELARDLDKYPGLSLVPSKHRYYPFGPSACHVLGLLGTAGPAEIDHDPFNGDELQRYHPHDLIGRGGIEALCEKTLRGKRGRIEKITGADETVSTIEPLPGRDVKLSIDIELQTDIEQTFLTPRHYKPKDGIDDDRSNQHGAAVIIKLNTSEVLAMASNPGFDPNTFPEKLPELIVDDLNLPLLNRATEMAVEPGSSVKPMIGLGAITDQVMTAQSTIQCRGLLMVNGKPQPNGKCWVYAYYAHHDVAEPTHNATSHGVNPLPDDMLTISDGLERSCNVVFETTALRMGILSVTDWFNRFGLGRRTGVGIAESSGRLFRPASDKNRDGLMAAWAGIGEQVVQATPIQMANVAATVARNGIWMRPTLVSKEDIGRATTQPSAETEPDRVDLRLSPEALDAVHKGMRAVCNSATGTGWGIRPENQETPSPDDPLLGMIIAGKTGTAQTAPLSIPRRDPSGHIIFDSNKRVVYQKVDIGTKGTETWYKSADKRYQHAWFIGYAPAQHPQIAFCVMVEYGEAGGRVAGAIAHDALVACMRHGYLVPDRSETPVDDVEIH